jgi:hypothetical protein
MVHHHISDELKQIALSMSFHGLSDVEIREITGISEQSLMCLRSTFHETGAVSRMPPGWFRVLTAIETKVCFIIS